MDLWLPDQKNTHQKNTHQKNTPQKNTHGGGGVKHMRGGAQRGEVEMHGEGQGRQRQGWR